MQNPRKYSLYWLRFSYESKEVAELIIPKGSEVYARISALLSEPGLDKNCT